MSKSKKGADNRIALQWAKTLRDLVELHDTTLANIKVHLLGRDETGAANEPPGLYTITYTGAIGSAFSIPCPASVGGVLIPVNKLAVLTPYFALFGLMAGVIVAAARKKRN